MASTYLLRQDFEEATKYYRRTVELEPRVFFTAVTAIHRLDREARGDLPAGTYLAYVSLEWITDSKKRAEAARQWAEMVPGFAPVSKALSHLADTDTERLEAIENRLAANPDPETNGVLLTNKPLALDRQGDHDRAVRLVQELPLNPQLPSGPEHMAKLILPSLKKK